MDFAKKNRGNILDLVGNTPLVEINRLKPKGSVRILAKIESANPGGSIKDRVALAIIEHGEETGELGPGKTIIEATSGNTGIGLAMVAAVKGYPILLTMAESASEERRKILRAYGAQILLTPAHLGTDGAIEEAYRLAREYPDKYFLADQFNNQMSIMAHYYGTGVEIWEQTQGKLNVFVATLGTSGTVMGICKRLKELNPEVRIVAVEPYMGHKIQGLKNMKESYRPGIFDREAVDEIMNIEDDDAFNMARRLAKEEGIFVGMSSGAAMAAAYKLAERMDEGTVVTLFPDGGERYLSTTLFEDRKRSNLRFFNTLTRKKEDFIPIRENKVGIYSCGPTVHELIHLGLCRRVVCADLIVRYLEYKGFEVTHIMNITDIDDKTIQGSERAGVDLKPFTDKYAREFLRDLETLRVRPATKYPRASEHVEEIIDMTRRLLDKGFAYEKFRSVYYDISRFKRYGNLSRVDLSKIRVGKTVHLDDYEKDNPRDFTLLKRSTLAELKRGVFYKTPWGNARPGWHIECSAMSMKYLGEQYDIHTSGSDLIFPHHENEIAISQSLTSKTPANYWMHSEPVMFEGKKMSSRGAETSITVRELEAQGYTGREIRFWLIGAHYRKTLNFSVEGLDAAKRALGRLDDFINSLHFAVPGPGTGDTPQLVYEVKKRFTDAMDDDLNVSAALAAIFEFIRKVNPLIRRGELRRERRDEILELFAGFDNVLQVLDLEPNEPDEEIEVLLQRRELARRDKKWREADELRGRLSDLGVEVIDTTQGPRWKRIDR